MVRGQETVTSDQKFPTDFFVKVEGDSHFRKKLIYKTKQQKIKKIATTLLTFDPTYDTMYSYIALKPSYLRSKRFLY